ncbi:MAG: hypothetical protein V1816_21990 [Pseudomonadota bacterium]
MKKYEYDVTLHPAAEFREAAYFCGEDGKCNLEEVPGSQVRSLTGILNGRGAEGWELVQLSFGRDGVMAFWKKELDA